MVFQEKTSPCIQQTEKDVERYYKAAALNAAAIVRQTQGGLLRYHLTFVENRRGARIHIHNFGDFYAKSGKNCFHPTGQTRLVVPTAEVLGWLAEHPFGESGLRFSRSLEGAIL